MLYIEFLFLLLVLYTGSRYGGIGLGVISGIGLCIEVFFFKMPPTSPPIAVMLIIMAVVTCASVLEAAGGLKYMLQIAERVLRSRPRMITLLGPLVTYTMTLMLGTGHAVYAVMPIIGDVALKSQIRPERPMAAASVASQLGITASPISAAVVYYLTQLSGVSEKITLMSILAVTFPATLCGLLAMVAYSWRRGVALKDDKEYNRRLDDPDTRKRIEDTTATTMDVTLPSSARNSVIIFFIALVVIVIIAMFPEIRTLAEDAKPLGMGAIIQMMMLAFGGIILIATRVQSAKIPEGVVFKSGMVAAIAIFGIAWMSDTYFQYAMPSFKAGITEMVHAMPWTFALAMFAVSIVINSQAATCVMMLPVGLGLGLSPQLLIGIMPASYGYFFIPNYPSDIATISFDVSGTTRIGKFYFNHSFMAPGIIAVPTACVVGYGLAKVFL